SRRRQPSLAGERGADPGLTAAGLSTLHQFAPAPFADFHAGPFRLRLDPLPGGFPLGVRDALDLVEAGDRVANMTGVRKGLFAFLWKGEVLSGDSVFLPRAESGHQVASLRCDYRYHFIAKPSPRARLGRHSPGRGSSRPW